MARRQCYHCKDWIEEGEPHDCWTTTEAALTEDLTDELRRGLTIHLVSTIDEVLLLALLPASRSAQSKKSAKRPQHAPLQ